MIEKDKIKFKILYQNGVEDEITQTVTEENAEKIAEIMELVKEGFKEEGHGYITLGDGALNGLFIRLSDVARISMEVVE